MSGQVVEGEKSLNHCLTFGYIRVQPTVEDTSRWKVHSLQWNGKKMPTIQFLSYLVRLRGQKGIGKARGPDGRVRVLTQQQKM